MFGWKRKYHSAEHHEGKSSTWNLFEDNNNNNNNNYYYYRSFVRAWVAYIRNLAGSTRARSDWL